MYSNGLSEVYLGKAIKELNLPRKEIVVMTKMCGQVCLPLDAQAVLITSPRFGQLLVKWVTRWCETPAAELDSKGFVNQHGLSRKARILTSSCMGRL